jgi:hypothetical protein
LQEGRENANIDAGLGFIWRISVNTGSNDYISARPEQRTVEKELEFYRKVWRIRSSATGGKTEVVAS